jgi:hypothetical protein
VAILARAAALNVRFVLAMRDKLAFVGRLGFRFSVMLVPLNNAFTCCSLDISASISAKMSCIFMNPPLLRINHCLKPNSVLHRQLLIIAVLWQSLLW